MKKSLRDLGEDLGVSHAQIKNWEDMSTEVTGLNHHQEKILKNHVLCFLISEGQRFLSERLLTQNIEQMSDKEPFDPYKEINSKIYKEGEKSRGLCEVCKKLVTITFRVSSVPLSSGNGKIEDILAARCDYCDRFVSIPQQSSARIREVLSKKKIPLK